MFEENISEKDQVGEDEFYARRSYQVRALRCSVSEHAYTSHSCINNII